MCLTKQSISDFYRDPQLRVTLDVEKLARLFDIKLWFYSLDVCYVINVIALSFVWNIYLSDSTINDVLFGARKPEINRGVSTGTLLVL